MIEQVRILKEDVDDVGDQINKGYLPRWLVWQTLRTMVWPSISYPLSSTTISEEESYEITKSLSFQILPSGGANHNFPTPYRHAPYAFYGLSLPRYRCVASTSSRGFVDDVERKQSFEISHSMFVHPSSCFKPMTTIYRCYGHT
jgi:hypothetical protein